MYGKKALIGLYRVTLVTWNRWTERIPDFGEYRGKIYTPNQIKLIIQHIGPPPNPPKEFEAFYTKLTKPAA